MTSDDRNNTDSTKEILEEEITRLLEKDKLVRELLSNGFEQLTLAVAEEAKQTKIVVNSMDRALGIVRKLKQVMLEMLEEE
jgi:nickel-dependent lactate racemase